MTDLAYNLLIYYQGSGIVARLGAMLRLWRARIRERRELAQLDERELHDIGMSRSLIYSEISKPFWRE